MATKEEHRAFIQEVQDFAQRTGLNWQFKKHENAIDRVYEAEFRAWWDGDWVTLARERYPMRPNASWAIYPEAWARLQAQMADSIARS